MTFRAVSAVKQDNVHLCLQEIQDLVGDSVSDLELTVADDSARITGACHSWHAKQLITTAVQQYFADRRIHNDVVVIKSR